MTIDEVITKFKGRATKQKFANAVGIECGKAEKNMLPIAITKLSEWAGKHIWSEGYKAEDIRTMAQTIHYDTVLGLGINVYATKDETVRQLVYQYVKFAGKVTEENDGLKTELDKIKSSFWYRVTHIFRK